MNSGTVMILNLKQSPVAGCDLGRMVIKKLFIFIFSQVLRSFILGLVYYKDQILIDLL
jgi:hypothetical protein